MGPFCIDKVTTLRIYNEWFNNEFIRHIDEGILGDLSFDGFARYVEQYGNARIDGYEIHFEKSEDMMWFLLARA